MRIPETFDIVTNWIVITGMFVLFGLLGLGGWLAGYRRPKAAPIGAGKWIFSLPVWAQISAGLAASALFVYLGYVLWIPLPLIVPVRITMILRLIGLALFLAGLLLAFWARWTLGAMWGVSTSFAVQLQKQHSLVQRGPYAFIRRPMYPGYWLLLVGLTLIYRTWSIFSIIRGKRGLSLSKAVGFDRLNQLRPELLRRYHLDAPVVFGYVCTGVLPAGVA